MKLSTLLVTGKKLEGGRGGPLFFMLPERGGLLKIRGGSHVIVLVLVHSTERHFIYALKTRNLVVIAFNISVTLKYTTTKPVYLCVECVGGIINFVYRVRGG